MLVSGIHYVLKIMASQNYIDSWMDNVYFDWIMLAVLIIAFRFILWIVLVKRSGI